MGTGDKRQQQRDSLLLMATCRSLDSGETCRIKVRNLSASGLMAISPLPVSVDEMLVVDLLNIGRIQGRVAWVHGLQFGLAFAHEIDPKAARHIREPLEEVADYCVRRPLAISIAPVEPPAPNTLRRI